MGSVYNQCGRLDDTQLYGCFDNAGYQIVQQVHVDQALTAEHAQKAGVYDIILGPEVEEILECHI